MTETLIQQTAYLFKINKFETLVFNEIGTKKSKFCFDLLVKKNEQLFTVKIFPNIDNLNPDVINDIKALSLLLKSKPILIGIKNRYQKLEDNTIYIRDDLPFITFKTLENILKSHEYPYVLARRGGGVIFLDGNLVKILREKKNISRKGMSEQLGVSKRTICSYENESMRPSEIIASKIFDLLQDKSIFRKINVFEWNLKFSINKNDLFNEEELDNFESHLQEIFADLGVSSYWYKKGQVPFKLTLFSRFKDEKGSIYPIFSSVSDEKQKFNELHYKCLTMFTNLFNKNALLIVDNNLRVPEKIFKKTIPIVQIKSLEKLNDEEEFIEFIQETRSK